MGMGAYKVERLDGQIFSVQASNTDHQILKDVGVDDLAESYASMRRGRGHCTAARRQIRLDPVYEQAVQMLSWPKVNRQAVITIVAHILHQSFSRFVKHCLVLQDKVR
jgi:hypothetical protein